MFLRNAIKSLIFTFCVCLLVSGFAPSEANARRIFLNGVNITGMTGQKFKNVTVVIDANGDIRITGKHYKVKSSGNTATPPKPPVKKANPTPTPTPVKKAPLPTLSPRPSKKYVMVLQRGVAKASGYSLRLMINGREARKVPLNRFQDVYDVTPFLKKGMNKIMVEAFKEDNKATGNLNLFITVGEVKGGRVLIQKPYILKYKRNGTESSNYRHVYNVQVQ